MKRINIASNLQIIGFTDSYNIVMFGAGNVATHISRHLHSAGHTISCIYSKTGESAMTLAEELRCIWTSNPEEVPPGADFFIICVPDQAIPAIVREFKDRKGIWLHTAGALSMEVFEGIQPRYGVIYPLQSLNKKRPVSWEGTPFLIEGSSRETLEVIRVLASSFTRNVHELNSSSRQFIHLAAVFANNFTNHMVHIAHQILMEHDIDAELLDPILKETFSKITEIGAAGSQTGPALRDDTETMQKHIELLKKHPEWEKLYTFISRDIGRSRKP